MSRSRAVSTLFALALLAACAVNPATGQRELSVMSPAREASVGKQAAAQVEQTLGLVDDPVLTRYVSELGSRLARYSPRRDTPYQFFVVDMPEANAFALPGGYIYVSRGLLALSNSEDELAGVIGHEIGHVAARHSAQRETRQLGVGLLSVLGAVAAEAIGGPGTGKQVAQLGQIAGAGFIASYGRDQERQADEIGQKLTSQAGFDPGGISGFLASLGRETTLRLGQKRNPTFLDSHPSTDERVATTRARAARLPPVSAAPRSRSKADFLRRLDGLQIGPDPGGGVFEDTLFLHPGMKFGVTFPRGWKTQNSETVVGALSPNGDAILKLELAGRPGDPQAAAQAFFQQNRLTPRNAVTGRVGGYAAYRARADAQGQQGPVTLDFTFVAHPSAVLRISGLTSQQAFSRYESAFRATAESFHPLTRAERSRIKEQRLRVIQVRPGDTLAAIGRRTGNIWSPEETAVQNGLSGAGSLRAGQFLKIAVERPY